MKKTAICGVMVALALIFSFIETLIPLPIGIPGVKLGLANLVVLFSLYKIGLKETFVISIARVALAGLLFSSMSSMLYALAGAILSLIIMVTLYSLTDLHIITISICGALGHILGQLLIAGYVVGYSVIAYYLVPLLISAFITGAIIGLLGNIVTERIPIDM